MGWQRQDHGPSVQQALEEALARMTGEQAVFTAAGRTDAGVHALAMSAHVDVMKSLTPHRLREGLNALVRPQPISVLDVAEVTDDWHARFSCVGRRYLYRILARRAPPALDAGRVWHIAVPLDVHAMQEGAKHLIGRHDFTTFRSAHCQSDSPVKTSRQARSRPGRRRGPGDGRRTQLSPPPGALDGRMPRDGRTRAMAVGRYAKSARGSRPRGAGLQRAAAGPLFRRGRLSLRSTRRRAPRTPARRDISRRRGRPCSRFRRRSRPGGKSCP